MILYLDMIYVCRKKYFDENVLFIECKVYNFLNWYILEVFIVGK